MIITFTSGNVGIEIKDANGKDVLNYAISDAYLEIDAAALVGAIAALTEQANAIEPAPEAVPEPDEDGWIEWGASGPKTQDPDLPKGALVDIELRDETTTYLSSWETWFWVVDKVDKWPGDIMRYRISK